MKLKITLVLIAGIVIVMATHFARRNPANLQPPQVSLSSAPDQPPPAPEASSPEAVPSTKSDPRPARHKSSTPLPELTAITNKLERLAQIRETFRSLAAGDPGSAMTAAKQITDATERETALLTLVTEWTHGELRSPLERADDISLHGLEVGLGMELVNHPELALRWANELTDGPGRAALIQQIAIHVTVSDPAAAFTLSDKRSEIDRSKFFEAVFAGWAGNDTSAALQYADQLSDSSERDAAIRAIRSVAPVGIGAEVRVDNGYAVINQLIPGTPADSSGQLHPGDRILALAQGDNSFVDVRGMPLKDIVDIIRGAPGTVLQLQVVSADAPQGSQPQIVSIIRDQIKLKR